jgi:hypothetical protein
MFADNLVLLEEEPDGLQAALFRMGPNGEL